jgi:hypothetical protein
VKLWCQNVKGSQRRISKDCSFRNNFTPYKGRKAENKDGGMKKRNRNGRKMRHRRKEDYKKTGRKKSGRMRRKAW